MWVYVENLVRREFTTGFYVGSRWHGDRTYGSREEAARRVHWLNGGNADAPPTAVVEAEHGLPASVREVEEAVQALHAKGGDAS